MKYRTLEEIKEERLEIRKKLKELYKTGKTIDDPEGFALLMEDLKLQFELFEAYDEEKQDD